MSEKMREEFELWAKREGYYVDTIDDYLTAEMDGLIAGSYRSYETRVSWKAWQASRSALVVELPSDISGEYYADGWNAALMCVEGRLKEAGVSYK